MRWDEYFGHIFNDLQPYLGQIMRKRVLCHMRTTTLVHAMLCISSVIDKCRCWLDDITFDWHHVMVTAVECNNQTRRIITFLCRLLARSKSKFHTKKMIKKDVKTKCKYKRWIPFFRGSWKYEHNTTGPVQNLGVTYFACDLLHSYFHEPQKNEIYFLNMFVKIIWIIQF